LSPSREICRFHTTRESSRQRTDGPRPYPSPRATDCRAQPGTLFSLYRRIRLAPSQGQPGPFFVGSLTTVGRPCRPGILSRNRRHSRTKGAGARGFCILFWRRFAVGSQVVAGESFGFICRGWGPILWRHYSIILSLASCESRGKRRASRVCQRTKWGRLLFPIVGHGVQKQFETQRSRRTQRGLQPQPKHSISRRGAEVAEKKSATSQRPLRLSVNDFLSAWQFGMRRPPE
jgi:hypothetical protein